MCCSRAAAGVEPNAAMRVPRAMPSNIWWNTMTTKRVMKTESPATTSVRPMTVGQGTVSYYCKQVLPIRVR
jgi:hypothetical protein